MRKPIACCAVLSLLVAGSAFAQTSDSGGVEFFEKRIRPLLVENCLSCHGPGKQQSGLRLDSRAALMKGGNRGAALAPGNPDESRLIQAVRYADAALRMPPRGKLTDAQIADLVNWVKLGASAPDAVAKPAGAPAPFNLAARAKHWAYQPIKTVAAPATKNTAWPRNDIDRFILARLEASGLKPATEIDRRAWIRRVTFGLIGLPPTAEEVSAFLADASPRAYERVAQRLLDSPHYGERWARHWLDLVRYAETYGHEYDFEVINHWRYRDYVIRAFNADVPYSQFVTEHLAGDLLPDPRRNPGDGSNDSILGTGFFWLGEAKHSPVDIRQEQSDRIDNQVDVFGKAFLAQTIGCARCHDHKFDAITAKDYYSLVGFFKSVRYQQAFIDAPERIAAKAQQLAALRRQMSESALNAIARAPLDEGSLVARLNSFAATVTTDHPLYAWVECRNRGAADFATFKQSLLERLNAQQAEASAARAHRARVSGLDSASWMTTGDAFTGQMTRNGDAVVQGDALQFVPPGFVHSGLLAQRLEGVARSGLFTIDKRYLHLRTMGKGGRIHLVTDGFMLIRDPICGQLSLHVTEEKPHWRTMDLALWPGRTAYLELSDSATPTPADFLPTTPADGWLALAEARFSDDRTPPPAAVHPLNLEALRDASVNSLEALGRKVAQLITHEVRQSPNAPWRGGDATALLNWLAPVELASLVELKPLIEQQKQIAAALPPPTRALACVDGPGQDEAVWLRGNYRTPGATAPRRFLEVFASTPAASAGSGRLELAQRVIDNPLFARVAVNRLWHHHFGAGLVRSPDDFGRMGQAPTHPELLDWLATQFIQRGYSIKEMQKLIVLSSMYRMGSAPNAATAQKDPQNLKWHHVPVRRLEAEPIRDSVLAVSGRLDRTLYGPSVPTYLTEFMEGRGRPQPGPLDGNGRRSIYLSVRRNFLNPMFQAFDFPTPFTAIGKRSVSNVPAQALVMMNGPLIVQQSKLWAERTLTTLQDATPAQRITTMYEQAFTRPPAADELQSALAFLDEQSKRYTCGLDDVKVWADLAHVLMNVKEFIFIR